MRFGYNYAPQNLADGFIIFVMEQGNFLQWTNPFHVSRFSGPRVEQPENFEDASPDFTTPSTPRRLPRSDILSNSINEPSSHFDIVHIDHAFQLTKYFNKNKNVLIVFPDDLKFFRSLTKTMDNNIAIIHDSIQ
jgi:hypothetical protein